MKSQVLDLSKRTDQFLVHLRMQGSCKKVVRFSISNLVTCENQVLDSSKRIDQFLLFIFSLTAFVRSCILSKIITSHLTGSCENKDFKFLEPPAVVFVKDHEYFVRSIQPLVKKLARMVDRYQTRFICHLILCGNYSNLKAATWLPVE